MSNNNNNPGTTKVRYPISYDGNVLWPILFLILFPPIGILLLVLNLSIRNEDAFYGLHYRGSQFWLIFWTILFFPIAIILGALTGFDVVSRNCCQ